VTFEPGSPHVDQPEFKKSPFKVQPSLPDGADAARQAVEAILAKEEEMNTMERLDDKEPRRP
jgi:hypothetical protein